MQVKVGTGAREWCEHVVHKLLVEMMSHRLVPRLSWNVNMYRGESLVSFLRKHDVIKIRPKQKGNILRVVQLTMRSALGVYDIRSLDS